MLKVPKDTRSTPNNSEQVRALHTQQLPKGAVQHGERQLMQSFTWRDFHLPAAEVLQPASTSDGNRPSGSEDETLSKYMKPQKRREAAGTWGLVTL